MYTGRTVLYIGQKKNGGVPAVVLFVVSLSTS